MRAQSSLPVSSVHGFGVWGAARSHDQKVKRLPLELATRSGTPGSGRLVDLRKVTASCNQCVEFRVAQRVPVPCVLVCDTGMNE